MKTKLFIITLFLLIFSSSAFSQNGKVILGAGGGIAWTDMRSKESSDLMNPTFKAHAGIFADFKISGSLYIGSGLNLRTKANRTDKIPFSDAVGNIVGEGRDVYNFRFLTIPVFLNYFFGKSVKYKLGIGGYYGVLTKAFFEAAAGEVEGQIGYVDVTKQYSKNDLGLTARLGIMIPIHKGLHLNLDVVDELGLIEVENDFYNQNWSYKTHSLSAGAGLSFTF